MSKSILEKLEEATEGGRELDAEIVAWQNNAIVKRPLQTEDFGPHNRFQFWSEDGKHFLGSEWRFEIPRYTTNLVDARTFAPRGWYLGLDPIFFEDGERVKYDAIWCRPHWKRWTPVDSDWIERVEARHDIAELAIVIAALKARQATEDA